MSASRQEPDTDYRPDQEHGTKGTTILITFIIKL